MADFPNLPDDGWTFFDQFHQVDDDYEDEFPHSNAVDDFVSLDPKPGHWPEWQSDEWGATPEIN